MRSLLRKAGVPGVPLGELLIALAALTIGFAVVSLAFPARPLESWNDRMRAIASQHAHAKLAELDQLAFDDPALAPGRHPTGDAERLGPCQRFYRVECPAPPLADLKRVTVTVRWEGGDTRAVVATAYTRR